MDGESKFDFHAFRQELDDLTNNGEEDFDRLLESARERISVSSSLQTPPPIARRHRSSPREEPPTPVETPDVRLFSPTLGRKRRNQPEQDSNLSDDDELTGQSDNNQVESLRAIIRKQAQRIRTLEAENERLRRREFGDVRSPGEQFTADLFAEQPLPGRHYGTLTKVMDRYFEQHPHEARRNPRVEYDI